MFIQTEKDNFEENGLSKKIKISIVMATYNGEKFIREQLDSFSNQTILPDELVVCDDCSSDNTLAILQEYKAKASFNVIILKAEKNQGSTKAFELAVKKATGDWIFFSDQDDVWSSNKIEEFLIAIDSNENNLGLVYSDYEVVDENLNALDKNLYVAFDYKNPIIETENAWKLFLKTCAISGCIMAVKKEVIENALPFNSVIHDRWIVFVASMTSKIKYIDKKLFFYRQHASQQIGINYTKTNEIDAEKALYYFKESINFEKEVLHFVEKRELFKDRLKYIKNTLNNSVLMEKRNIILPNKLCKDSFYQIRPIRNFDILMGKQGFLSKLVLLLANNNLYSLAVKINKFRDFLNKIKD